MVGLNSSIGIGADERAAAIAREHLGWSESRVHEGSTLIEVTKKVPASLNEDPGTLEGLSPKLAPLEPVLLTSAVRQPTRYVPDGGRRREINPVMYVLALISVGLLLLEHVRVS